MPSALPGKVFDEPLEDGAMVSSPADGSTRPMALARPQSTTSVSPCLPTIMFAGLMSRCITPRRVGVVDRVADIGETSQELPQLQRPAAGVGLEGLVVVEPRDRLLERVTLDEPHRVVRPAAGVRAQAVDGDDARVLQPAGDLGLGDESLAAAGVVGVLLQDLLERHLAMQLVIERHEHGAQTALRVGPQDAEPLSVGGGRADGIAAGAVGVIIVAGRALS